ncbi:hypothetical protein BC832DRAFT_301086 [Gaertneriomyces semiglobifer]|nr:hypothetical protein BC832DRAFT_301086 [Gaertneriomyces semiglobifer]
MLWQKTSFGTWGAFYFFPLEIMAVRSQYMGYIDRLRFPRDPRELHGRVNRAQCTVIARCDYTVTSCTFTVF